MPNSDKLDNADWLMLTSDEKIIHATHPSIWPILQQIAFGVVIAIVGVGIALQYHFAGLGLTVVGLAFAAYAEVERRYRWYVLTTEQIWKKRGIVSQTTVQSRYDDIENIRLNKSVIERLLNFGDLAVSTAGTSTNEFWIENVPNAKEFKSKAIEQVDIVHERGYYQSREEAEETGGGQAEKGRGEAEEPSSSNSNGENKEESTPSDAEEPENNNRNNGGNDGNEES